MKRKQPILIVEDSPIDFEVTQRALSEFAPEHPLYHCKDGSEALDYLYCRGDFIDSTKAPRPSLVLLDLNMPKVNGREVLEKIKQDEGLKLIPIVVMTNSVDRRDVNLCYSLGANSYLHKSVDLTVFKKSIEHIIKYWFDIIVLPG